MEVYRNNTATITLQVPVRTMNGNVVAKLFFNGNEVFDFPIVTEVDGGYSVTLPFEFVQMDANYVITWTFDYTEGNGTRTYNGTTHISVVTPILSFAEIKKIVKPQNPSGVTDTEASDLERKVRKAIESFTGQIFGELHGRVVAFGTNGEFLKSPLRILELTAIGCDGLSYDANSYIIKGDGWLIQRSSKYPLTIKSAPSDGALDYIGSYRATRGPIYDPFSNYNNNFSNQIKYEITGIFGYYSVPQDVEEAARLLVNDYSCNESLYRERYIANIRAADWRFDFKDGAYLGTGNVMADQLLSAYQRSNLAVI